MADNPLRSKEIPLNGKLITSVDPATIDINFQELKNLRYTDTGLRAISGMSKINSTAITTYTKLKSGFHFNKAEPAESHVLVQAYNSGETASQVFDNTTAIPSTGDFSATSLHTDSSGAGRGYFSDTPGGSVAYCNSVESMLWGGNEHFCSGFIVYDSGGSAEYDYSSIINNTLTTSTNIATLKHTTHYVGAIQPLTKIKYYVETANTDTTDTITVHYWNGSAWVDTTTAGGSVTDGTEVANARMAQTGTVEFPDRVSSTKVKNINGVIIYWYKVTIAGVDATTTVSQATVSFPFQTVKDIWSGEFSPTISFQKWASSTYADLTIHVSEQDYTASNTSTWAELHGLTTSQYVVMGFTEKMSGAEIIITDTHQNDTAATTLIVSYWNGTAWAAVSGLEDGTSEGSISFAKAGTVTWDGVAVNTEFVLSLSGEPALYYYKFSFDKTLNGATTTRIVLDKVEGIVAPKDINAYKFPVFAHSRLFLCSNQNGKKNTAIASAYNTANVFNGDDFEEFVFGNDEELTAGAGLFRQYNSSLYNLTVFTKASETWILVGKGPEDWVQYKASDTIGCPAPDTMVVANVGFEAIPTQNRYVAIWQGLEGLYLFDGTTITEISKDISDLFDKRDSNSINTSMVSKSVSFFDHQNQEYHWLFAGGTATSLDKEMVYDLVRQKWYEIDRGTGEQLQMGLHVTDTNGNRYNYGGEDDGFMYRLDNGNQFEDNDIVASFRFGDIAPHEGSINTLTRLRRIKLVTTAKTSTTNSIVVTYKGDGVTTGTALTTMSPSNSGYRTVQIVNGTNQGKFTFHDLDFSMTTDDESISFEPLFVGLLYTNEGLDMN